MMAKKMPAPFAEDCAGLMKLNRPDYVGLPLFRQGDFPANKGVVAVEPQRSRDSGSRLE